MTNINDIPFHEMSRELQKLEFRTLDDAPIHSYRSFRPVFRNPGRPGWIINLWNGKDASYRYLIIDSDGSTVYSRQPEEDEITGESNIPTWFGRWSESNDGDVIWLQLAVMDGISANWPDSCLYLHAYKLLDSDLKKQVDIGDELLPCKMDVDRILIQESESSDDDPHLLHNLVNYPVNSDLNTSSDDCINGIWEVLYKGYALDLEEAQELMESAAITGDWTGDQLKELMKPIPHTYSDFQVNGVKVPNELLSDCEDDELPSSRIVDHKKEVEDNEWSPSSWRDLPPFLIGLDASDKVDGLMDSSDEDHDEFWSKADSSFGPAPVAYEFDDEGEDPSESESYK